MHSRVTGGSTHDQCRYLPYRCCTDVTTHAGGGCVTLVTSSYVSTRRISATTPDPGSSSSCASPVSTVLPLVPAVSDMSIDSDTEDVKSAVSYGYYMGLGRDMCGSRRSDTSDVWSNGPMHEIRPGRCSYGGATSSFFGGSCLHVLSAGPDCPPRSGTCF